MEKSINYATQRKNHAINADTIFVFDLHDVLFERNYRAIFKIMFSLKNKIKLMQLLCNPRFIYDAFKMLSVTRVSEAYIVKLSQQHTQLEPYVETIIDMTNALSPIWEMFTLIENLKLKGHKIYIFSNIGYRTFQKLTEPYHNLFSYFDGIHHVEENSNWLAKPHQDAYHLFLKKFTINPQLMVFIDDKPKNVIAAQEQGITAIHYRSTKQLLQTFKRLGLV